MTPTLKLNNGVEMPAIGLGVFQTPPEETTAAVVEALRVGYRHIDTAAAYGNEREVGEGIRRSEISRENVFIETKVWISDYGYDSTLHAFEKSAGKLGVEQLDLLLLHQPMPSAFDLTLNAYRALEKLLDEGKVRAIGVSNFMPEHLERLLAETSIVPPPIAAARKARSTIRRSWRSRTSTTSRPLRSCSAGIYRRAAR